jgi:hypothetical protein
MQHSRIDSLPESILKGLKVYGEEYRVSPFRSDYFSKVCFSIIFKQYDSGAYFNWIHKTFPSKFIRSGRYC